MIAEGEKHIHYNYFLAIESDTEKLSRYVEFTNDNFKTYSIEIAHLLLATASEVDVVAKILCKKIDPTAQAEKISEYRKILKPAYPKIQEIKVLITRYGLKLEPWSNWKGNKTPDWWISYNKVKHERNKHFEQANLKNALNAVAGLFVLLLFLYRDDAVNGTLVPSPTLFRIDERFFAGIDLGRGDIGFVYRL
jgi:hypothetical protein